MIAHDSYCVTTASAIEGWEIEEHLGLVASHAVAGTGLVSEFFAGFSDIFGGRSESYRRQLEALYRDTVTDLLRQARTRGGNWLVGLRIDLDEVSGKGTQMFMITGLATAVRAQKRARAVGAAPQGGLFIDPAEVKTMMRRLALLEDLKTNPPSIGDSNWAFPIENRVEEACTHILRRLAGRYNAPDEWLNATRRKAAALFSAVSPEFATDTLYDGIRQKPLAAAAIDLIADCSLGSIAHVFTILQDTNLDVRCSALQTIKSTQPAYSASSLSEIDTLCQLIPSAFRNRSTVIQKKSMLGGTKDMWQCSCGRTNPLDDTHCGGCSRDQQGFTSSEVTPATALALLQTLRAALAAVLESRGGATAPAMTAT